MFPQVLCLPQDPTNIRPQKAWGGAGSGSRWPSQFLQFWVSIPAALTVDLFPVCVDIVSFTNTISDQMDNGSQNNFIIIFIKNVDIIPLQISAK